MHQLLYISMQQNFCPKTKAKRCFFLGREYFDVDDDEMLMKCAAMESIPFMIFFWWTHTIHDILQSMYQSYILL